MCKNTIIKKCVNMNLICYTGKYVMESWVWSAAQLIPENATIFNNF